MVGTETVVSRSWAGQHKTHSPETWSPHMSVGLFYNKGCYSHLITVFLGSLTQELGFSEKKRTTRDLVKSSARNTLVLSLPFHTGDEIPDGAKQEAELHCVPSLVPTLQGSAGSQDYTARDPFCSRQALLPHYWAALQREMNHCPCQIAFHFCHQGSLSNRRF